MPRISHAFAMVLAGTVISGCTTALPPEKVEAIGPPFNDALKERYIQLAATDGQIMYWPGGGHFYQKARAAMLGDDVWPDKVGSRDIAPAARPEALALRERLVSALLGNARATVPLEAAQAQASFDCWLRELEQSGDPALMTGCKQSFLAALEEAEAAAAAILLSDTYEVFFAPAATDLGPEAVTVVDLVARDALAAGARRVEVVGYTDRAGDPAANQRLAQRRADSVAEALRQAGVPSEAIDARAGGAVGGVDDRQSRRVDIILSR